MRALPLPLLALLGLGCLPDFDDDLSVVEQDRIVAVQAVPAEARPNATVALTALIVSPDQAPPTPDWFVCVERKPLTELGSVNPDCVRWEQADPGGLIALGNGVAVEAQISADACRLFGPTRPAPEPGQPAGRPVDPDPTGGWYQPVAAGIAEPLARAVGSIRLGCALPGVTPLQSLEFAERYRPNENPIIDAVTLDGGEALTLDDLGAPPATVTVGARVVLGASWTECPASSECGDGVCGAGEDRTTCADDCTTPRGCTGAEPYVWFDPETRQIEPRREGLSVAWYTTAGRFAGEGTEVPEAAAERVLGTENVWRAPATPQTVTLWAVIRDDRGGQSWRSFRIEVVQ